MANIFSQYLNEPVDSVKHQRLRAELWLAGPAHACRYYLSLLAQQDFFDATDDEFLNSLREYIVSYACPEAVQFCVTQSHLQFVLPFLKQRCEDHTVRALPKEEHALILLVQHPDWTNREICEAIGTTEKTMKRWSTFNAARIAQEHYENRRPGWC